MVSDQIFQWNLQDDIFSDCPQVNSAFRSQLNIGWYYFLCGLLSSELVDLQASHYLSINSKQSSRRWATNLIKKLWFLLHEIWNHRNNNPHQTNSIHRMTKLVLLKDSISTEYSIGLGHLPQNFSSYFHLPLPLLLKRSTTYLKRWFLVIRSGRECHHTSSSSDIFSINGPLRRWVKLKPLP